MNDQPIPQVTQPKPACTTTEAPTVQATLLEALTRTDEMINKYKDVQNVRDDLLLQRAAIVRALGELAQGEALQGLMYKKEPK